jgi:hypothetical protein
MRSIGLYFALVGLVALLALGRSLTRCRKRKGGNP